MIDWTIVCPTRERPEKRWERVPARDDQGRSLVIHLYDRIRPELSRGVPWLAPVIELLKTAKGYTDDEATAAAVSAFAITDRGRAYLAENEARIAAETRS